MIDPDRLAKKLRENGQPCIADLFTDERGIAWLTGAKPRTLRAWRAEKRGPPCMWVNRWLYDLADLANWLESKTHRQQAAPGGRKRQEAAAGDMDCSASRR